MADALGAWDLVDNMLKRIHDDIMVVKLQYKTEIYPKAEQLWPGLDKETYLLRLMKELVTNHGLLLPVPSVKQMKAVPNLRIDARKTGRSTTVAGNVSRKLDTKTKYDFCSHSPQFGKIASSIKDMIKKSSNNLRPLSWFAVHITCLLPYIFLSARVQSWVNALSDMEIQGDLDKFVLLMDGTLAEMNSIIWCRITESFVEKIIALPGTDSMSPNEINDEWTKVRQLIKLLVITLGPQAR